MKSDLLEALIMAYKLIQNMAGKMDMGVSDRKQLRQDLLYLLSVIKENKGRI